MNLEPNPAGRQPGPYTVRQWISLILVVAGCGLLGYVGGQYWYMVHTQRQLEASWQSQANASGGDGRSLAAAVTAGKPLTRLMVPKINLEAIVLEGSDRQQLIAGPGHITDTAMPGETGNAVITAHRDTFFRHIFELEKGDEITVQRDGRTFRYRVTSKRIVPPTDLSVLRPTTDAQLTLITCYPIYYIGPAPQRLVVFSKLVPEAEPVGQRPATMY
ncbi:MAG TPA: class D sortase [Terriglobales bacterium]